MAKYRLPRVVKDAETQLASWARLMDRTIDGLAGPQAVALAFGGRGWTLYRGFQHSLSGPSLDTAHVDLRALLDVTMLTRWIEDDPKLRIDLWLGEDERQRLVGIKHWNQLRVRRGESEMEVLPADVLARMQSEVDNARQAGRSAGLSIRTAGSILPNIEQMVQSVDDLWEVYYVAYRHLSPSVHAGGRSFVGDEIVNRSGGRYLVHRPPFGAPELRALAVPAVCMLFASVSRQVGLGIEAECDALRMGVVTDAKVPPPRL